MGTAPSVVSERNEGDTEGEDIDTAEEAAEVETACIASPVVEGEPRKLVRNGEVGDWQLDDDAFAAKGNFSLPGPGNKSDLLSVLNVYERDARIEFFEKEHKYQVDRSVRVPRSVTGLVHQFEHPFDADEIIKKMRAGKKWPITKKKYTKTDGVVMTDEEIKAVWDKNRDVSSRRGTLMHWHIEMFLNGAVLHGPFSTEFGYFLSFYRDFFIARGMVPVRTELSIFHTGLCVAGQIDLLAKYEGTQDHVILDWKRSKEIKLANPWESLIAPLDHLQQTNLNVYSLQLNAYRYILQSEYGFRITEMYLVICHENHDEAKVIRVEVMDEEMRAIVERERELHGCGEENRDPRAPFSVDHLRDMPAPQETASDEGEP